MRLPRFQLLRPTTLPEASELLSCYQGEAKLLAGGTDILPAMKLRLLRPAYLIDLKGIEQLSYIRADEEGYIKIGPLTTIRDLQDCPLIRERLPLLGRAASLIAARQIQNMATIGGNLCLDTRCWYYNQSHFWRSCRPPCYKAGGEICHAIQAVGHCYAVFSADLAPCLIALSSMVRLNGRHGERVIPLEELYSGDGRRPLTLAPDEILTEIRVPLPANDQDYPRGCSYQKLRDREAIDFPLAGVAVSLTLNPGGKVCQEARIVINAVGSGPRRVSKAEELLRGGSFDEETIEEAGKECYKLAHPVANTPRSPAYRRKAIPVLFRRAIQQALVQINRSG